MDAVEFLKERKRLCSSYKGCAGCPFGAAECVVRDMTSEDNCKRIVSFVEQWSKEHPIKTRQSVFLEQFPKAGLDVSGVITICPAPLSEDYRNDHGGCKHPDMACSVCRREFWSKEV